MPTAHVTVPRGLHPTEAARVWQLHVEEGMAIRDVCDEVVNMLGGVCELQPQIVLIIF